MQPPNDKALWIVVGAVALTAVIWFGYEHKHFEGPPQGIMIKKREAEIVATEKALGQAPPGA